MTRIKIPRTVEEATDQLGGLGQLLTAKQWERAAIVYAFTEPGRGRRTDLSENSDKLTPAQFARLGIAGLRDEETVAWMRNAWQDAIEDGQAKATKPGDAVVLPDREFPKHPRTRSAYDGFAAQVRKNPEAIRELVKDEPDLIEAVAAQVASHPGLRTSIEAKATEIRDRIVRPEPAPIRPDYDSILLRAVDDIMRCLRAEQRGEWQPETMALALLHFVSQMITERAQPSGIGDDLFGEIETFLRQEGAAR